MRGDFSVASLVVWYVVFLFSTTFHEFAHASIAYLGGDRTAYDGGQVSLDPVPHIRRAPFGLVVIPLISFLLMPWMIGWASAPYDPRWAVSHPRRFAAMSLAGPAANLLLAVVAFVAIKVLVGFGLLELAAPTTANLRLSNLVEAPGVDGYRTPMGALAMGLSVMLNLNVILCVFNLLPVPPLDGASVLEGLSRRAAAFFARMRMVPAYSILGLVVAWHLFPYVVSPALVLVYSALHGFGLFA